MSVRSVALAMVVVAAGAPAVQAADIEMPLVLEVTGASRPGDNRLRGAGPDDRRQYGTVRLSGETRIGETPVGVEILGSAAYLDGSGPFRGYLTLEYPNGDRLGFTYDAVVRSTPDTTSIEGVLQVLGGTGVLAEATGTGTVSGVRTGPLGSPLAYTLTLDVAGMPAPDEIRGALLSPFLDPDATGVDLATTYRDHLAADDRAALADLIADGFLHLRADGSVGSRADVIAAQPSVFTEGGATAVESRAGDVLTVRLLSAGETMLLVFEWTDAGWRLVVQADAPVEAPATS